MYKYKFVNYIRTQLFSFTIIVAQSTNQNSTFFSWLIIIQLHRGNNNTMVVSGAAWQNIKTRFPEKYCPTTRQSPNILVPSHLITWLNATDCAMPRWFAALIGGFAQLREPADGKVTRLTGQDEAVRDDLGNQLSLEPSSPSSIEESQSAHASYTLNNDR